IDEKNQMESQGVAAKEDVVLSNYISNFVRLAMEKDPAFAEKKPEEKRAILQVMAKEKLQELSSASQIQQDIFNNPGGPPNPANNFPGAVGMKQAVQPV
ncbi:MAG TPA: hypothetical protein PLA68_16730, partial [Panacibacter sp.]|nr:hypothetical protein [Panacibacter sp.]